MNKLKNLLQYDASKFIHISIIVALYILSYRSYIAIILLLIEIYYIFKKSKNIIIYALIIILIITFQIYTLDNKNTTFPITGEVTEVNDDYFLLKSNGIILCYYNNLDIYPGMVLEVEGYQFNPKSYQIMNTFDYETYLQSEKIKSVISVYRITIIDSKLSIFQIKYQINEYINNNYQDETASFLKLFILGEKDEIYSKSQEQITNLGISHLFAISGMHLGLIIACLNTILKRLYLSKETNSKIIFIFLIIYNIITGFKISILRASLLVIGLYIKNFYNILLTKTDLLSFSFIGFLIINPYYIYNIGFQLSYIIAFSIIMGDYLFNTPNKLVNLCKLTIFANLISLPIILNLNHRIGLIFIFANIFFLYYVKYIFLPISFIVIFIPKIEILYSIVINIFNYFMNIFSEINILITFNFTQKIFIVSYWLFIFLIITTKNSKKKLTYTLSIILLVLINITIPFKSNEFVRFLDVSQGDSIHIHSGQCDMLIDTGDNDNYDTIKNYFISYNIKKIDILLITHFHSDHFAEVKDIANEITVENIYVNNQNEDIKYPITILKENDVFNCGNASFKVISASTNSNNENNNSIVLYGSIGEDTYLFTGDIEAEVENYLIENYNLKIDILKVPHHGSSTSSTREFIESTNPQISIISVGENNGYDLPDLEVISRYSSLPTKIYRTDESGTITIYYYNFLNFRIIETYKKNKRPDYHLEI